MFFLFIRNRPFDMQLNSQMLQLCTNNMDCFFDLCCTERYVHFHLNNVVGLKMRSVDVKSIS